MQGVPRSLTVHSCRPLPGEAPGTSDQEALGKQGSLDGTVERKRPAGKDPPARHHYRGHRAQRVPRRRDGRPAGDPPTEHHHGGTQSPEGTREEGRGGRRRPQVNLHHGVAAFHNGWGSWQLDGEAEGPSLWLRGVCRAVIPGSEGWAGVGLLGQQGRGGEPLRLEAAPAKLGPRWLRPSWYQVPIHAWAAE